MTQMSNQCQRNQAVGPQSVLRLRNISLPTLPDPLQHDVALGDVLPRTPEIIPAQFGRLGSVVELLAAVLSLPHD